LFVSAVSTDEIDADRFCARQEVSRVSPSSGRKGTYPRTRCGARWCRRPRPGSARGRRLERRPGRWCCDFSGRDAGPLLQDLDLVGGAVDLAFELDEIADGKDEGLEAFLVRPGRHDEALGDAHLGEGVADLLRRGRLEDDGA
jgi:hypothetical protein